MSGGLRPDLENLCQKYVQVCNQVTFCLRCDDIVNRKKGEPCPKHKKQLADIEDLLKAELKVKT